MKLGDTVLIVGAAMRATRLVVADSVPGQWWIKAPIDRAMERYEAAHPDGPEPWWWKYRAGLDCPHCVGLWLSGAVVGSYALARLNPLSLAVWRFGAAVLATNAAAVLIGGPVDYYASSAEGE